MTSAEYLAGKNSLPYLLSPDPAKALFMRAENVDIVAEEKKAVVEGMVALWSFFSFSLSTLNLLVLLYNQLVSSFYISIIILQNKCDKSKKNARPKSEFSRQSPIDDKK